MLKILAIGAVTAALVFGSFSSASAHPPGVSRPGSAGVHSPAGKDDSVAQLPFTDREFLRASAFDDETRQLQDAAIALAHAQCDYLGSSGNTPATRTYLAEEARPFVEYPYLFLEAAVGAYCPQHTVMT